jgi:peroxiredoxin
MAGVADQVKSNRMAIPRGKVLPEITAPGASLVAISPQLPEHNRELARSRALGFPSLTDPGNAVASKFGLTLVLPDYRRALYATFPLRTPRPFE